MNRSNSFVKRTDNEIKGIVITCIVYLFLIPCLLYFGLSYAESKQHTFNFKIAEANTNSELQAQVISVSSNPVKYIPSQNEKIVTQSVVESIPVNESSQEMKSEETHKEYLYSNNNDNTNIENFMEGKITGVGKRNDDNSTANSPSLLINLTGRNLLSIPPIDEEYTETGKVSVSIKVDRNGKVLFAKYTQKGSTTTNQKLIKLAVEAVMQAKFSPNSKVAEEQFGTITFTFKLK